MMHSAIPNGIRRMHQLAWQPGAWMHAGWWTALELAPWQDSYRRYPACRSGIDRLIVARRGFPRAALPGALAPQQAALLALEPRLPQLITALGLLTLNCPDYLLMGPYRRALKSCLGERGGDQLLALHHDWRAGPAALTPDALAAAAFDAGSGWWRRDAGSCMAHAALAILLPPTGKLPGAVPGPAADWLIKIGRFL